MKSLFKFLFTTLFLLVFGYTVLQLFFPDFYQEASKQIKDLRSFIEGSDEESDAVVYNDITIAYAYRLPRFEPTLFNPNARARLLNVYEPLVKLDKDLRIVPCLASTWGLIDDTTWEFVLRPGVKFHDRSSLTPKAVIRSIDRAQNSKHSELKSLLASIVEVKAEGKNKVIIKTDKPDPLLLNKLSTVLVFSEKQTNFTGRAVGSGPFKQGGRTAFSQSFEKFDGYWGKASEFQGFIVKTIPEAEKRVSELKNGLITLLVDVPPSSAKDLEAQELTVLSRPSLQVNYLLFNFKNPFLKTKSVREAIASAFDKEEFVRLSEGYARPVNQFVSNGVFGFNVDLPRVDYDLEAAQKTIREFSGFERPSLRLAIAADLTVIGGYIEAQLEEVGIDVTVDYLSEKKMNEVMVNGGADLYFLGWKSELGDSSDFLNAVAHSVDEDAKYGAFNVGGYRNERVDSLIEQSSVTLDEEERREQLKEIMYEIVVKDVIGVPLYESMTLYAFSSEIEFEPRVDGYILPVEISSK